MLIVMKADATDAQIAHVVDVITELGFKPHAMPGATRTAIGITGNPGAIDPTRFENLPGVAALHDRCWHDSDEPITAGHIRSWG